MYTIQIFICTTITMLTLCQTSVIMIPPDIQSKFIQAKDPAVYNINDDPFDKLTEDERIDLCDLAIKSSTYMWHENEEDMWNFIELPVTENYQRKSKENKELKPELNVPDQIDVKFKDRTEPVRFKRIFCSLFDRAGRGNQQYYQELYISYGKEPGFPFILARNEKDKPLEIMGTIDRNEITWKSVPKKNLGGLVRNLSNCSKTICTLQDEGLRYEICSRVHYHMFPEVESGEDEVEEDGEQFDPQPQPESSEDSDSDMENLQDTNSQNFNNSIGNDQDAHSEYTYGKKGADPHKVTYEKLPSNVNDSSEHLYNDEEANPTTVSDKKLPNVVSDDSFKKLKISDNEEDNSHKDDDDDDDILDEDDEDEDEYEYDDEDGYEDDNEFSHETYTPNIYDWFDRGEEGCNAKHVSVNDRKSGTVPVECLSCVFGENLTEKTEVFAALKKVDGDRVSAVVMTPKNYYYNKETSPLEVRGVIEFKRH